VYICHHKHCNQLINNYSVITDVVDVSSTYYVTMEMFSPLRKAWWQRISWNQ